MSKQPILVLTRPKSNALRFADLCRAKLGDDVPIVIAPLMTIEAVPTEMDIDPSKTFIFTSENGVKAANALWPDVHLKGYSVGDRTAEAGREVGYELTSAGGSVEELLSLILKDAPSTSLVHLRGADTRGDLALRLSDAGHPTSEAILYRQVQSEPTKELCALLSGEIPLIVPLFSPRSAAIFQEVAQAATAPLFLCAISENTRNEIRNLGRDCIVATTPDASAMVETISALVHRAGLSENR